jgi:hypothetical protein
MKKMNMQKNVNRKGYWTANKMMPSREELLDNRGAEA